MKTMLGQAIVLATQKHEEQYDKGGRPYILHVLTVMHRLRTDDEELQCIAVLHDIIEDTDCTYKELEEFVTPRVIAAVKSLTKVPGETHEEYKARVLANPDALRVKKEDLRHNSDIRRLKGVDQSDIERMVKYHNFYLEIIGAQNESLAGNNI